MDDPGVIILIQALANANIANKLPYILTHILILHLISSKLYTIKSHIDCDSHNYNVDLKYILGSKAKYHNCMKVYWGIIAQQAEK